MQIKPNAANVSQAANNFAGQRPVVSLYADLARRPLSRCLGGAPAIRLIDDPPSPRRLDAQSLGAVSTRWTFAYPQWRLP